MIRRPLTLAVAAACGAIAISGCEPRQQTPKTTAGPSPSVAAQAVPPSPDRDPSLPPASSVVGNQPQEALRGQDSPATAPKADLTKREEQSAMPKPGQANTHSAISMDDKPSR